MSADLLTPEAHAARAKVRAVHPQAFYDQNAGSIAHRGLYPVRYLSLFGASEAIAWLDAADTVLQDAAAEVAQKMRVLEASLAFEHASSTIECNCVAIDTPDGCDDCREWYDIAACNPDAADCIEEAVKYLAWRELLVRHAANPNQVAVKDEHEAGEAVAQ